MKRAEVPQDDNAVFAGERKALYALDDDGRYTTVPSSGWTVEQAVTGAAVDEFRRLAREAHAAALRGEASTLAFHLHDRRFDAPTLAQTVGTFTWRVRRHLQPAVFARLSDAWLARYAAALGIGVEALRSLPETPP